ncbi:MAG: uridine phosphorylase [Verrucomicrobia bacterium]|nr:uridine phosphorylase [Verrucomicrobiota bacterium]
MNPSIPLLQNKLYVRPAVFAPGNLVREARRQKSLPEGDVPPVCVLDPDGNIVAHLLERGLARPSAVWPCYHTRLHEFTLGGRRCGMIGHAVGGAFAVLLAEQLFASGCRLLLSVTSAGQIVPLREPPYFVLIERALRDEGASYHYLPPQAYARLNPDLDAALNKRLADYPVPIVRGAVWTTDAPYRETEEAIASALAEGILAVEMEAASLDAFAEAHGQPVVCFAHVTNRMGVEAGDFEKGEADGSVDALKLLEATVARLPTL